MTEFTQSELTAIRMTVRDLVGYDEADAVSFRIVFALSSWHDAPTAHGRRVSYSHVRSHADQEAVLTVLEYGGMRA